MRTFCLKLLGWISGLVVLALFSRAVNERMLPNHAVGLRDGPVQVLIAGDSHAASALDPDAWEAAVNVGLSLEPIVATFYKLRFIVEQNPSIESVLLTLGPQNLPAAYNDTRWADAVRSDHLISSFIGIVPIMDLPQTPVDQEVAFAVHLREWWTPNLHLIGDWWAARGEGAVRDHVYVEGFRRGVTLSVLTDEAFADVVQRHWEGTPEGISSVQLAYVDSIVDWAGEANVDLTIVNTPLHPRYIESVPVDVAQAFDSLWAELDAIPHIDLVDLSTMELGDDMYRDFDHVNVLGAARVSEALTGGTVR